MQNSTFDWSEKRRFARHVFSAQDEVEGYFNFSPGAEDFAVYKIADISAGGLRFYLPRKKKRKVEVGDSLTLIKIMGKMKLAFVTDSKLLVRWVVDHDMFQHLVIGCKFEDIGESDQGAIDRFVRYEAMRQTLKQS